MTSFDRVRGDPRGHVLQPDNLQAAVEGKTESGDSVELASQWTELCNCRFNGLRVVRGQKVSLQGNGAFGLLVSLDDLRVAAVRLAALLADAMRMVRDDGPHDIASHFVTQLAAAKEWRVGQSAGMHAVVSPCENGLSRLARLAVHQQGNGGGSEINAPANLAAS